MDLARPRPVAIAPVQPFRRHAVTALAVAAMLGGLAVLIQSTGGLPSGLAHLAYFPVVMASIRGGWRAGVLAGVTAGLVLGPLMSGPPDPEAGVVATWGWVVRLGSYTLAGFMAGWSLAHEHRLGAEIRAAEERARLAATMRDSEARLRSVVEASSDGMILLGTGAGAVLANAAAERLFGIPRDAILAGAGLPELLDAEGRVVEDVVGRAAEAVEAGAVVPPVDVTIRRADGSASVVSLTVSPLPESSVGGRGAVVTLRDVTAERAVAASRAARAGAISAASSRAAGRSAAADAGATLLGELGRLFPLLGASIYRFEAGSAIRLASWAAPGIDLPYPARLPQPVAAFLVSLAAGGEIRWLSFADLAGEEAARERLRRTGGGSKLIVPLVYEGHLVGVLAAVDRRPPGAADAPEIEDLAELGRTSAAIVHRAQRSEAAALREARETTLAILDAPDRLVPAFQPIVSLRDGSVAGYEALSRFPGDPQHSPAEWFGVATAAGLGAELQALALARALELSREHGLPPGAFLTVNVSPAYLSHPAVARVLEQGPVAHLVIELTEDDRVDDYAAVRAVVAEHRARGCRFAVDDAGAGYASMRHVTELRPEFVKLDAQLIAGLSDDAGRVALVRALEAFAAEIGATIVAEGIERPRDLALLVGTGLPLLGQGYALARPGPAWPVVAASLPHPA